MHSLDASPFVSQCACKQCTTKPFFMYRLVPDIDPKQYTLTITGVGVKETVFTLEDLKKFPRVDVTSVETNHQYMCVHTLIPIFIILMLTQFPP
jgi:hypothetical protein